jgi:DNA-binding transcriptional LysR family regulator
MLHHAVPDLRARELLTVVALAEYGSFVAAAAFLKTSQPALTRTLKRVEAIVGVTLFARTTRRVEITPAGREFVAVAERVLNDLQISMRNMSDVAGEQRGQVILSTYSAFAYQPLPQIIDAYRATRPSIEVRIREGRQPDILEDVRSGVADFGIGYVDTLPDALESVILRREPLFAMLPADHRLAVRRPARMRLVDLRNESLVSLPADSHTRRLIDGAAGAAGFAFRQRLVVSRFETVVRYVRSGAGIGIIPGGALPPKPWTDFHAAPLHSPALGVTVGLMLLRNRHTAPAAASLIALVTAAFRRPGRARL